MQSVLIGGSAEAGTEVELFHCGRIIMLQDNVLKVSCIDTTNADVSAPRDRTSFSIAHHKSVLASPQNRQSVRQSPLLLTLLCPCTCRSDFVLRCTLARPARTRFSACPSCFSVMTLSPTC